MGYILVRSKCAATMSLAWQCTVPARVSGHALAGEVLVSRTVTDLVVGSGINFEDRGDHQLKGLPGAWRLFAALD